MSEMVERVAMAIHEQFRLQRTHTEDWPTWGELLAQGHQGAWRVRETRELARAAIAAMRDPTDALIQAGLTGTIWNYNDTHAEANKEHPFYVSAREGQAKAWRAMIDEALK